MLAARLGALLRHLIARRSGQNLAFDFGQDHTCNAAVQALRDGHPLAHGVHEQLCPLFVELISQLAELRDLFGL